MTVWPAWYKAVQSMPGLDFEAPEVWDFTLFDGDAAIWANSAGTS